MLWHAFVLAAALAAAVGDLGWRRISKWLSLPVAAAGLIDHALAGGLGGALAAMALGLAVGALLLYMGAIAGGDAKWLAALGALMGLRLWFWSLEFGLLAAAAMAPGQMARRGRLGLLYNDLGEILAGWREHGLQAQSEHCVDTPGAITAPFALAMFAGVVCALCLL
ncbi:MAG: prepilin peptidase [Terriglobales bacterium]